MQKLEAELSQAREALGGSQERVDTFQQELGHLRRTVDTGGKETQSAHAEVRACLNH